jgi:hypothetical protein
MFVAATIATNSPKWGLAIMLFMCLSIVSMYTAFIILVLAVAFLSLAQGQL